MPTDLDLRAAAGVLRVLARVGVVSTLTLKTTTVNPISGSASSTVTSTHSVRAFLYTPEIGKRGPQGDLINYDALCIVPRTDIAGSVLPAFDDNEGTISYSTAGGDLSGDYQIIETQPISTGEQAAGYVFAVRRG